MKKEDKINIYQAKNGSIELKTDVAKNTIWATQAQIAELFEIDRSVATKHIGNILKDKEVDEKRNVQKMHIANSDKLVAFYSLDIILAVGYRSNSGKAIQFRQWATKTLRSHIVEGYTINKKRLARNYDGFLRILEQIKGLLPAGGGVDAASAMELVKMFANTWLSLDAYDKSKLPKSGLTKKQVDFTAEELNKALENLKDELIAKGEASALFGVERGRQSLAGIVGNVFQGFGGEDLYPTVEEKAAHLLYFMVKNHPFTDGNKRSGAFVFVWFLNRAGILNPARLTAEALTALTLFVAESHPKEKEKMVGLILMLLANHGSYLD